MIHSSAAIRQADDVDKDARAGEIFKADAPLVVACERAPRRVRVALQGPGVQQVGEGAEDREDNQRLDDRADRVEHCMLGDVGECLLLADHAAVQRVELRGDRGESRPLVQVLHEDPDRDNHQEDQRKRARHRFQRTPQQQTPLAAGDVLQHQHAQAAARKREAEHESPQGTRAGCGCAPPGNARKTSETSPATAKTISAWVRQRSRSSGEPSTAGSVRGP